MIIFCSLSGSRFLTPSPPFLFYSFSVSKRSNPFFSFQNLSLCKSDSFMMRNESPKPKTHNQSLGGANLRAFSNSDNNSGGTTSDGKLEDREKPVVAGRKRSSGNGSCDGGEHDIHIWTERERRKKMRNMLSCLHALLPQLPAKIDKSTILDETVKYIKSLQENLQKMQKQKLERLSNTKFTSNTQLPNSRESFLADHYKKEPMPSKSFMMGSTKVPPSVHVPTSPANFQTWLSPNVVLNMCGRDAQISGCAARKQGLLSTICYIMEKHRLEVVSAHICSDQFRFMFMIHARAGGAWKQNPEAFSVEEIFKLAVGEMNLWLASM